MKRLYTLPRNRKAPLTVLAVVSAMFWWLGIAQWMQLTVHHRTPHLDMPKLLGVTESSLNALLAVAGAQILVYLLAAWSASLLRGPRQAFLAISLALVAALPLVLTHPAGAGDVYAYIAEADLLLRYGLNPFSVPVAAVPDHSLLPFLDFPNETTHYGPLWVATAALLRLISGPGLLASLVAFKLFALACLLLAAWICYLAWRDRDPVRAPMAAVLVAWNPLLIFELAGNAHNDIAMMVLVALAFLLQSRDHRRGAIAALIAACLIKYVAVVLVPLFLLANARQGGAWMRWLPGALIDALGLGLLGGAALLIVGTEGTLGVLQRMTEWYTTSLGAAVYYWLSQSIPRAEASQLVGQGTRIVFLVIYALGALWLWRRPASLRPVCLWLMLAFMAVQTVWFQPWYVTWALPLAVLAGGGAASGALIGMTVGGFGIHAVMGFGWRLDWHHGDPVTLHAAGAAVMWLPVAVGLLGALIARLLSQTRLAPPNVAESSASVDSADQD